MEHLQLRRKLFNKLTYALVAFIITALLAVSGFYGGALLGIGLLPFAWVFVAIEAVLIVFIAKLVLDEEKLEAGQKSQSQ
ncbi:MAG: hypothetical protein ABH863_00170 [Candidatus Micrarchaeota archaeon]